MDFLQYLVESARACLLVSFVSQLCMAFQGIASAPPLVGCPGSHLLIVTGAGSADSQEEAAAAGFSVQQQDDRLLIALDGVQVAEFVHDDSRILRPYFSNIRLANGTQVTRNHPPVEGVDSMDHESMHPGIWLGFGDISGQDFWRNKARIRHRRFLEGPELQLGELHFATECQLEASDGQPLSRLVNEFRLSARPTGWLLQWQAAMHAEFQLIEFGDQEEMGFGVRVATDLTEKNGGRIANSSALCTAKQTWGQSASWCDYSGAVGKHSAGITLMASPNNFRESWWHNRDYGLMVANPFGRQAMQQGQPSSVVIPKGQSLQLGFAALIHDGQPIDLATEFDLFVQNLENAPIKPDR